MKKITMLLTFAFIIVAFAMQTTSIRDEAQSFIDEYTKSYRALYHASSKAEWKSNTRIVEGDTMTAYQTNMANEMMAKYTGAAKNIEGAKKYLIYKDSLSPLQVKQLHTILYQAAANPQTVAAIVKRKIKADTEQNRQLFAFDFKIDDKSATTNEIDEILRKETNPEVRLKAWNASKEVGKVLKDGLAELRDLRNQTVQALDYDDYFAYQVSDYGMTSQELTDLMKQTVRELWPLYREIHTYARYELAKKYGVKEVPDMLPAHWLPNRWGQDLSPLVEVKGFDLDSILGTKSPEWIVKQGERFYVSLGFSELPKSFWGRSSLYPVAKDVGYKKNNHASAWHLNLEYDVRSLMSVESNSEWYETSHHELGHIYYFISYSNPDVPVLLRNGANRGFHEALGSLMGLAAMQKPYLVHLNLLSADAQTDDIMVLLKEALNYVVFIPFSAGVMTEFENDLYSKNLPKDQFNKRWWELKKQYQGIVPPSERGEEYCDAGSKTHINNDAAQYYDYAISYLLLFQFHDHIAKKILKQNAHATNYYGNEDVGKFLTKIMYHGATVDWRALLIETTGENLSAKPMLSYFEPLMEYLKKENEGREYTLPE